MRIWDTHFCGKLFHFSIKTLDTFSKPIITDATRIIRRAHPFDIKDFVNSIVISSFSRYSDFIDFLVHCEVKRIWSYFSIHICMSNPTGPNSLFMLIDCSFWDIMLWSRGKLWCCYTALSYPICKHLWLFITRFLKIYVSTNSHNCGFRFELKATFLIND